MVSNVAHPGTNLKASGLNPGRERPSRVEAIFTPLNRWGVFVRSVGRGLPPARYAETSLEAQGGRFYGPDGLVLQSRCVIGGGVS
jgi:hypothetical protein